AGSEEEMKAAAEQASVVKGVTKVVSYVKVRGKAPRPTEARGAPPPPPAQQAQVAAPQAAQPAAQPAQPSGPIQLAPASETPAPIVPPDRPPTTRQGYTDPYGPGAAPPPGRNSTNSLTSQPLAPIQQ